MDAADLRTPYGCGQRRRCAREVGPGSPLFPNRKSYVQPIPARRHPLTTPSPTKLNGGPGGGVGAKDDLITSADPIVASNPETGQRGFGLRFHPALIVVIGTCAVLFREAMHVGLSGDVFYQVAEGRWMLAHHAVVSHDVFSYTVLGRPWLSEEWGFALLLAWLVAHVGAVSYWLVSAGACCGALLLSVARWRKTGSGWLWTAALCILAGAGMFEFVSPRPQDLSYLLFATLAPSAYAGPPAHCLAGRGSPALAGLGQPPRQLLASPGYPRARAPVLAAPVFPRPSCLCRSFRPRRWQQPSRPAWSPCLSTLMGLACSATRTT